MAGASAGGATSGDPDAVIGSFITALVPATDTEQGYTTVSGRVYDGVTPSTVVWDLLASAGGCQLLKPRAPFCSTPCQSGQVCVEDEQCASYPSAQDLGPVVLKGLGSADITMKSIASSYQLPGDVVLPFPPASEGAPVSIQVAGGLFGAFSVQTKMVAPLVSASAGALSLEAGKPLALLWQAAGAGGSALARMQIKVDISHHGGQKGKIECDVADSGSLEIPATLIAGLIELGVAGFPSVELARVATSAAAVSAGKVRFQVLSSVSRELIVPGVQSCHADADCASGKPCRQDLTCTP